MSNRKQKTNKKTKGKKEQRRTFTEPPPLRSNEDVGRWMSGCLNPDCLNDDKMVFPARLNRKVIPTYRCTVPDGIFPGQSFRVTMLGHISTIVCPAGSGPGQTITLQTSLHDPEPKIVDNNVGNDNDCTIS